MCVVVVFEISSCLLSFFVYPIFTAAWLITAKNIIWIPLAVNIIVVAFVFIAYYPTRSS